MTGGVYGVGKRMSLKYTRALITRGINGDLENVAYETLPILISDSNRMSWCSL